METGHRQLGPSTRVVETGLNRHCRIIDWRTRQRQRKAEQQRVFFRQSSTVPGVAYMSGVNVEEHAHDV